MRTDKGMWVGCAALVLHTTVNGWKSNVLKSCRTLSVSFDKLPELWLLTDIHSNSISVTGKHVKF